MRLSCAPFRIGIWTAATPDWADAGLSQIFAETDHDLRKRSAFIWTRERCARRYDPETQERVLRKPLQKVWRSGEFLRERTFAVDDLARNFACAYGNLITVRPCHGDPDDQKLLLLGRYLERIWREPDYRRIEKRGWRQTL